MKILYRKKIFYGWYIVGALFIANFLMQGGVRNGYGIFVETWEKEFVASTASISLAASIGWLINGLSQPILGRLADIYGGKIVALISLIVLAIGGMGIALANGVIYLIISYGVVISIASAGLSPATVGVVIVRWFNKRRGTALSILAAGGSAGGLICVPLMAYLMLIYNWRVAWVAIAILGIFSVPIIWILVKNHPKELNMKADGENIENSNDSDLKIFNTSCFV